MAEEREAMVDCSEWVDVTQRMKSLQATLKKGQMLHREDFNHERVMVTIST